MNHKTINNFLEWADIRSDFKAEQKYERSNVISKILFRGSFLGAATGILHHATSGDDLGYSVVLGYLIGLSIEDSIAIYQVFRDAYRITHKR